MWVHVPSFLVGSAFSGTAFLFVHQQLSYRSRLSKKWPLRGKETAVCCEHCSDVLSLLIFLDVAAERVEAKFQEMKSRTAAGDGAKVVCSSNYFAVYFF